MWFSVFLLVNTLLCDVYAQNASDISPRPTLSPAASNGTSTPVHIPGICGTEGEKTTTKSNADVAKLKGCIRFFGSLTIHGHDVNELASLTSLVFITGNLEISGTSLTSLKGLESLERIGDSLLIQNNLQLLNVFGFQSLLSVEGSLSITGNPKLNSISGLKSLQNINAMTPSTVNQPVGITISGSKELQNLDGLNRLNSLGNALILTNLTKLQQLAALPVGPFPILQLTLNSLPALSTLTPLTCLTTPLFSNGVSVTISNTMILPNLAGLENLGNIANLTITHNANLMDIAAITRTPIAGPDIEINDNGRLCDLKNATKGRGRIVSTCGQMTTVDGVKTNGNASAGGFNIGNAATPSCFSPRLTLLFVLVLFFHPLL